MDEVHLKKVLAGDKEAFRYFVHKYQDMAYALALGVVKQPQIAEEVVQDAFVRAFHKLGSFRKRAKFSTWLYRIVINEALRKAEKGQRQIWKNQDLDESQYTIPDKLDVSAVVEAKDKQERMKQVLKQLKPLDTLFLQLFYWKELSIEEIQDCTGFSESKIKVSLHRARKRFEKLYVAMFPKEVVE